MPNWEYLHEYVEASAIEEKRGMLGMGAPQEVAGAYPVDAVQRHLNSRGSQGWDLVSMEPHWHYERVYISAAMSITRPLAITRWYLTFKRERGFAQEVPVEEEQKFQRKYCPPIERSEVKERARKLK